MTNNVGIWIDHKQAIIVFVSDTGEQIKHITSDTRKNESAHEIASEAVRQRHFEHHLNAYYREVIGCIKEAHSIFVCGPGEAKLEFQKQIKSKTLIARIAGVETADKMTEPQLVAQVKQFFDLQTTN
jgi:stalled ribosome rescue protein Dom34